MALKTVADTLARLQLPHLHYFWVVARQGGIAKVAVRLGVAVQSPKSSGASARPAPARRGAVSGLAETARYGRRDVRKPIAKKPIDSKASEAGSGTLVAVALNVPVREAKFNVWPV